jgi:hypothetical protein
MQIAAGVGWGALGGVREAVGGAGSGGGLAGGRRKSVSISIGEPGMRLMFVEAGVESWGELGEVWPNTRRVE